MKIHVHDPSRKSENDHQNISCLPSASIIQRVGAVCCPGEATQVYLNHTISQWNKEIFVQNMSNMMAMLAPKGIITIKDTDLLLVANSIMKEPTNRNDCVSLLTKAKWIYDMSFIKDFLKANSFTITNSYYVLEDCSFTIIGGKN